MNNGRKSWSIMVLCLFFSTSLASGFGQTAQKPRQVYDPLTGQLIESNQQLKKPVYDPLTGKRIPSTGIPRFDPLTGLPLQQDTLKGQQTHRSLLTPREKSRLIQKKLKITSLNGMRFQAQVVDLSDKGLVYVMEKGASGPQTLAYGQIMSIALKGNFKGMRAGAREGLTSCGFCVAIPAVLTLVSGSGELMILAALTAPVVGLSSFILGSLSRDKYMLNMSVTPEGLTPQAYQRQQLLNLISLYLVSGFP